MAPDRDNRGARRLRALIRELGEGSRPIVEATGADTGAVSRWARGERTPDPVMRARLEDHFGIGWRLWDLPAPRSTRRNGSHAKA